MSGWGISYQPTPAERLARDGVIDFNSPVEIMRFTLVFKGSLPAARQGEERTRGARKEDKHRIRRYLHPQLRQLWETSYVLERDLAAWEQVPLAEREAWEAAREAKRTSGLVRPRRCRGLTFVPLVTEYHALLCDLRIWFLRMEEPGKIITSNGAGDLDNRLKVLFDALTVPQANQLPDEAVPSDEPLFCLLEDDKLLTGMRVDSERLYETSDSRGKPDYVELVIRVRIRTQRVGLGNLGLLGD